MKNQPEALRLADELDYVTYGIRDVSTTRVMDKASDELRRLAAAEAQRDALLEALKKIAAIENRMFGSDWEEIDEAREIARAAIAAAEGEGK